jgi:hypothetical protein
MVGLGWFGCGSGVGFDLFLLRYVEQLLPSFGKLGAGFLEVPPG